MGRNLADFEPLWPAERKLVEGGMMAVVGDVVPGDDAPHDLRIRASFLRFLALGGCEDCRPTEKGIRVQGAYVHGDGPEMAETRGLDLAGLQVAGDLIFRGCTFPDPIILRDVTLRTISFEQSRILCKISAERAVVKAMLVLDNALVICGLSLERAEIGSLRGQRLILGEPREDGSIDALRDDSGDPLIIFGMYHARIQNYASFYGARIAGRAVLQGVYVGGELSFFCAELWSGADDGLNPWAALDGRSLRTDGDLDLRASIRGQVDLSNARIGGTLKCQGGNYTGFRDPHWTLLPSVILNDCVIDQDLYISGAKVRGCIQLIDSKISGNLFCEGVKIDGELQMEGGRGPAIKAQGMTILKMIVLRSEPVLQGIVDFTSAAIGEICDAPEAWPSKGDLILNNCRYGALSGGPVDAKSRLRWLALQDPKRWGGDFWPQPYQQLASVMRAMGHDDDAKTVLMEKERQLRAAELRRVPWWRRPPKWVFTQLLRMVGYGYRPARALIPAVAFVILGWGLAALGEAAGLLAMAEEAPARGPAPTLVPLAYSFEAFVPIISIGQTSVFKIDMAAAWGWWLQVYFWIHGLAGWLLGGLAAAGIFGVFRRE